MNSHLIVTGANGFVGRHLIAELNRTDRAYEILDRKQFLEAGSLKIDNANIIIHLAGLAHVLNDRGMTPYEEFYRANCDYALKVAKAASQSGLKRFVYVSSIGVYGKSSSNNVISESSPLQPVENYAKSKLEAERTLHDLSTKVGFELVIVRPALVYGFDAPGNIARLLKLSATAPIIPIAESNNSRSFVYVENLVDFLLLAARHKDAAGKEFNVADGTLSTFALIDKLCEGMQRRPLLFSLPRFISKTVLSFWGKQKLYEQLFEDLVLDTSRAVKDLGWSPKYDIETAVHDTGKQFMQINS